MNHGLTLIVREFGEVGCAHTLRVYKVFTKTGGGPWLRGASALGLPENKLHCTVCIVLLSEFVSWNAWLQHINIYIYVCVCVYSIFFFRLFSIIG